MNLERTEPIGMMCSTCQVPLMMSERQNIEVDYCPKCRGVWLDRGELDKILERTLSGDSPARASGDGDLREPRYSAEPSVHGGKRHGHGSYRRKSWLQEIFD